MKSENPKRNEKRPTPKAAAAGASAAPKNGRKPAIPAELLEGDTAATTGPERGGPGRRYSLGATPPQEFSGTGESGELPEAYGTKRLLLAARDPRWLYAHWDLTRDQLKEYNALSVDRHLVIRVYKDEIQGQPLTEIHVHPESRNWFINVPEGGTKYQAQLGYYGGKKAWVTISTSAATLTPPDTMSNDVSVWFETLPAELQFSQLLQLVKTAVKENVPLMEAIQQLRAGGYKGLPDPSRIRPDRWTAAQDKALSELITMDRLRRVWIGSLEITELIRRQLLQERSSAAVSEFSIPSSWSGAVSSFSSPLGGWERKKGFWFNVNAELIIYGATEPDAEVKIGERVIRLRPDGTFSFRFSLPDGKYDLPAIATSADGTDSRSAALAFSRKTDYRGDVGKHPQDPKLREPSPAHVA